MILSQTSERVAGKEEVEVVRMEGVQGGVVVIDMGGVIYGWHRESARAVGEAINGKMLV